MEENGWIFVATGVFLFFALLFGGAIHSDHIIAHSPDPITTACALGKERACTALANRK